ncbi:MAG: glycoside hydrolase family 43 protein [Pedobacter sp.]|nr:MAG: glycoside hydrolase family 43 protein [Pedobacter sp.]
MFRFLIFLGLFTSAISLQAQNALINPILPGFYPDPSIIKNGSDYYLVNSTFVYFPGIPVFHSKDLKNWKQIGNVVERKSQMDFMGEQVSRGLFAPTINYNDGVYYIMCTDIDNLGNFIMTAKNPAGPWSNPIVLPEVKGIDPSLFFDGARTYVIYNSDAPNRKPLYDGHRTIRMYELDKVKLKVKGEEVQLVNGGVDISKKPVWIEGPHIYKRGEYYFLTAAEGGTSVNHTQVVFRSRDVKGPYIPYDKNPILSQRHLDPHRKFPVTSTGHADLVEGPDGKTYAVFLGVRPYEGNFYNTGRETFIAPVSWETGWPVINPSNEAIDYAYNVDYKLGENEKAQNGNFNYEIRFEGQPLDKAMLFLRSPDSSWYKSLSSGLELKLKPETVMERGNPAFIGRRQQHLVFEASTELEFSGSKENEKAGMIMFQNEFHFYYICKSTKENGLPYVQLFKGNPETKKMDLITEEPLKANERGIRFKVSANNARYVFSYAQNVVGWKEIGGVLDGKFLSTQAAGGFVGSLFGLYATSSGVDSNNKVIYKSIRYEGNDEVYRK